MPLPASIHQTNHLLYPSLPFGSMHSKKKELQMRQCTFNTKYFKVHKFVTNNHTSPHSWLTVQFNAFYKKVKLVSN